MGYRIKSEAWSSVFAVPSCVVDNEIKLAGAVQLKVLLWILRNSGAEFTAKDISNSIGIKAPDIEDAIQYWCIRGLLLEDGKILEAPELIPEANKTTVKEEETIQPKRILRPDNTFVAKRIDESEEIAYLMHEAQVILGKVISPGLSSTLIMIHDDYGLPVDVILMILQYAKIKGKDSTSYIEAIGKNWAEEEITTHELAELKLQKLDEAGKAWDKLRYILHIEKRSPSRREEEFAGKWISEWKFSEEMIKEAYDRCVDSTGKMSMSYINKILEKWHEKGIKTLNEAADDKNDSSKNSSETRGTTYDIDEFESLLNSIQISK